MRDGVMGEKPGSVFYTVKLNSRTERIQLHECRNAPDGIGGVLYRFDRPIVWFIPSDGQVKKIQSGKGTVAITKRMVDRARNYGFGR